MGKERMDTRVQSDRWSYLWLAIAGFLTITIWVVVRGRRAKRAKVLRSETTE